MVQIKELRNVSNFTTGLASERSSPINSMALTAILNAWRKVIVVAVSAVHNNTARARKDSSHSIFLVFPLLFIH